MERGLSYPRISRATGYSVWSVGEIVRGALGKLRGNQLEEHQDRHFARLEELYRALEPAILSGEPAKEDIDSALKILDRESRLLGLDAAKKGQLEFKRRRGRTTPPSISDRRRIPRRPSTSPTWWRG